MKAAVAEIAPDVYRIATFVPDYGMEFVQFLVVDDEPTLIHTGFRKMFPITLEGVASVVDPLRLRWVGFSHYEADECGALNDWLRVAPESSPLCSFNGAMVSVNDTADRPARALADGEVLATGRRRLRFLATPHVPHGWDAGVFYEEADGTLFCSDLLFHPGLNEPLVETDIVGKAREAMLGNLEGPLAKDMPVTAYTGSTLLRLAGLEPKTLALMHGSSYRGDGGAALRSFAALVAEVHGTGGATA